MSRQKLSQQVLVTLLITLLLAGCGGSAVTPTPGPPNAIPTQAITLATSTEEILGTWEFGRTYIRFDRDGTFRQASSLSKLDSRPFAVSSYQFEGTTMMITEISVAGVPTCGEKTGSYEIQLLESGDIRIDAIQDECAPRAGDIAGEYEPLR